ncbi:uncharacterized protein N7479_008947 [Penicillium vulpinum]|uniref:uncharacterized protein n=1 Tax=Penicillium vulpinum TaxID=29845 RepID=UPI0025480BDA|nr:uncharacterized protein N7479_008947 [Penicillium vulpinum]KAJ5950534.1 hypothetical protein N7479_008947 [Penicillium vulpinum]
MTGRAETRTPEPRLLRPRRSTRPPNNYAQEQELDIEQSNARSQETECNWREPPALCIPMEEGTLDRWKLGVLTDPRWILFANVSL